MRPQDDSPFGLEFVFGLPELKAVLLAVGIISVWAALRYGRRATPHRAALRDGDRDPGS